MKQNADSPSICDACWRPGENHTVLKVQDQPDRDLCMSCSAVAVQLIGLLQIPYSYYPDTRHLKAILEVPGKRGTR